MAIVYGRLSLRPNRNVSICGSCANIRFSQWHRLFHRWEHQAFPRKIAKGQKTRLRSGFLAQPHKVLTPITSLHGTDDAVMLGEDEELLWDLTNEMEPEDNCLWIWGIGNEQTILSGGLRRYRPRASAPLFQRSGQRRRGRPAATSRQQSLRLQVGANESQTNHDG